MHQVPRIERLQKSFDDLDVLKGIDLTVEKGQTIVVLRAWVNPPCCAA